MPVENPGERLWKISSLGLPSFFSWRTLCWARNFSVFWGLFATWCLSWVHPSVWNEMWMNVDVPFFFMEITQFVVERIRHSFSSSEFSLEAMAQLCTQSTDSEIQALVMFILHHVQDKLLEKCCFINTSPYSCLDLHMVSFLLFLPIPLHPN